MANVREISGNTIGNNVTIVQGDFNTANPSLSESNDAFLNKISRTDPFYDKKRILELKGPFLYKSFSWILDHTSFKRWRFTEESGVLWIKGDPGKGKTMLLCGIIDELENNPGRSRNLGYFFCQATDSRINTATSVVAGLIFSLIKRHPKVLSSACKEYKSKLSQLDGPNAWVILCDIFKAITKKPTIPDSACIADAPEECEKAATQKPTISDPVCIVDALDECEQDCKLLLSLIVETSTHVKWLISSRNVTDIERGLQLIEPGRRLNLELKENAENVSNSVDAYINKSVQDIEALKDDKELRIKTITTLKRKASGTFLWVALVIEQLRDTDRRNVEEVLEEIPEGLENLYDQIVRRASAKLRQKDREACQILLSIVTTAERPLHLEELHIFISSQWAYYKSSYDMLDIKDMVRSCGSLLAIRDDIIYFIHQSVKDYIVGNAYNSVFPSGIQYQHRKMFETSMSAMSRILKQDIYNLKDPHRLMGNIRRKGDFGHMSDTRRKGDISPPHPDPLVPIKYSCVFWVDHLIRGYDSEGSESEECFRGHGLLKAFLKTKYLCWLEALALLRNLTPEGGSALQRLNNQAASYYKSREKGLEATSSQDEEETNCLIKLIGDAYRFFHYCQDFVRVWPLQVYYSAIVFEDECSTIRKAYQHSTRAHSGEFFTFIKKPQRRFSLQCNTDVSDSVSKLLYSPDSSMLCVLSEHREIISLYRTDTLERATQLHVSIGRIYPSYVSFLPDSRHLVLVYPNGIIQTRAIDSGALKQQLSLNLDTGDLLEVSREEVINLSPNADLAASMSATWRGRSISMKIWATETGICVCEIKLTHMQTYRDLHVFAPNSALIALKYGSGISIYSTRTGNAIKHFSVSEYISHHEDITCLKFSKDSALLAFVESSKGIDIWCTESWTMIRRIKIGVSISDFDLSVDASMFVAASKLTLVFGSTRTEEKPLKIAIGDRSKNVSFSPDWPTSSLLASASSNAVQIWRVDNRDSSVPYAGSSVTISPGSKYVAARSLKGYIDIWCGKSGECIQVLKGGDSRGGRPVFSPNLEFVASVEGWVGDIRIWRLATGKSLHLLESHRKNCWVETTMVYSDDSKYLATGYHKAEIRVWCTESGKCLFKSERNNNEDLINFATHSLAISLEPKYIAGVFRWSRLDEPHTWKVRIWDWRAGHDISAFDPKPPEQKGFIRIESHALSSDATVLVVIWEVNWTDKGGSPYEAQIWEVATGTCITCISIGKSYSKPFFDPTTNKILTDRAAFRKKSSWEYWEKVSRREYSISYSSSDETWVCSGGEKAFLIPEQFSTESVFDHMAISSSLLAYVTLEDEIMVIQLPSEHGSQRLGIVALDSDNVGDSSLSADGSDYEDVNFMATDKSGKTADSSIYCVKFFVIIAILSFIWVLI